MSGPQIEKKNVSILSQTLQDKVFRVRQKTAEEIAEENAAKQEKKVEVEEIRLKLRYPFELMEKKLSKHLGPKLKPQMHMGYESVVKNEISL